MTAANQTTWARLIASTLADAGIVTCAISPGSRSAPLVVALAREPRLRIVTLIDERTAGFYALGAARATGRPTVLVCTSGSAIAHYLPAIIEASMACVPLVVLTANRPPELAGCGATQTIEQRGIYGAFVRRAFDLGQPAAGVTSLRAARRTLLQATSCASGPVAGPVHVDVPLREPLEPAEPTTSEQRELAAHAAQMSRPVADGVPTLAADARDLDAIADAIRNEPRGVIVAGAMPVTFAGRREVVWELARRTGYPVLAEAGSQLRLCSCPDDIVRIHHLDVIPVDARPHADLVLQVGAQPVAASWRAWVARLAGTAQRWVLGGATWRDPEASATRVVLGDEGSALAGITDRLASTATGRAVDRGWLAAWEHAERRAADHLAVALASHTGNEVAAVAAAVSSAPDGAILQVGNSLPIRVIDYGNAWTSDVRTRGADLRVITQRGAAGIDGLIASAAGATCGGRPVLLVIGDVSFAHDVGGLLATRALGAPLAIVVIDNGGGQIFAGLPIARAPIGDALTRHFVTPPGIDPACVAAAFGVASITASSDRAIASAVAVALRGPHARATVIHAPVSASGAHHVRRAALELADAIPATAYRGDRP